MGKKKFLKNVTLGLLEGYINSCATSFQSLNYLLKINIFVAVLLLAH